MIYILIGLLVVKYRHDIIAIIPRRTPEPDPLERFGGLTYEPTEDQPKHLRRVK